VPGVVAVSYSTHGVFSQSEGSTHVTVPGFVPRTDAEGEVAFDAVGPEYFHTLGARLTRGRDLDARDAETGAPVAVVNETMARFYFAGRDPIGRTVVVEDTARTVVGVVRDVEQQDVRARPVRQLYLPLHQGPDRADFYLELRTAGPPARLVPAVRRALLAADPALSLDVAPLDALVRRSVAQDVLLTRVTAAFGVVALALTALGLYGVTAYATAQRTGELGLRLALGAAPGSVTGMVLREALGLAAVGLGVGLPLGLAATRYIRARLFGVGPADPVSLGIAVALLVAAALAASWLPARRAARVGPLAALRTE
jgi:predicted permease